MTWTRFRIIANDLCCQPEQAGEQTIEMPEI